MLDWSAGASAAILYTFTAAIYEIRFWHDLAVGTFSRPRPWPRGVHCELEGELDAGAFGRTVCCSMPCPTTRG